MKRIIAVANQKGGVGKTTTSVNLAASLALSGSRVLMIDLDPQGNATMGSGVDKSAVEHSIYDWLIDALPLAEVTQRCQGGYALIPSNTDLTAAEVQLMNMDRREFRLKERLAEADAFDYVIIDCPPSLNILTLNALIAASSVLIPMQCEYYALEGLTALLETVGGRASQAGNPDLAIEGLLRTMYDPRNSLTRDVSKQLIQYFGDQVFRTVIPRNVRSGGGAQPWVAGDTLRPSARGGPWPIWRLAGELRTQIPWHVAPRRCHGHTEMSTKPIAIADLKGCAGQSSRKSLRPASRCRRAAFCFPRPP